MSETNRRKFLAVAGGGVAASAAGVVGMGGRADAATLHPTAAQDTVVAYIKDHRSSELVLMVGEHEVTVHDRALVTRILNAAGGK